MHIKALGEFKMAGNDRGQVIINTGTGKGKTTAALGMAVRAAGHGQKVLILQFIKGAWKTGESKFMKKLAPEIEMIQLGKGFFKIEDGKVKITPKDRKEAREAFEIAADKIMSGKYELIVLDEIINLLAYDLIGSSEIISLLKGRPQGLSVVLTGRGATKELIDAADTVSEIKEIKHAFSKGIKAKKGIEY
jgi:cob(I)alamin adenosyltransferase